MEVPPNQEPNDYEPLEENYDLEDFEVISLYHRQHERKYTNDDLSNEELKDKYDDLKKTQSLKGHLHIVAIGFIYIVAFIMAGLIIIRSWHFIAPETYLWLDSGHLHDIERIIFSTFIVGLLGRYFKKYLKFE